MTRSDLAGVERIGEMVHPDYPEDAAIIAERLQLYPAGCFVLAFEQGIQGYAVSHPWLLRQPPGLNTRLQSLPARADTFYIHDVALMPETRGAGLGREIVSLLARQARVDGLDRMSLIAVGRSRQFWQKNGFEIVDLDAIRTSLLTYGEGPVFMARRLP